MSATSGLRSRNSVTSFDKFLFGSHKKIKEDSDSEEEVTRSSYSGLTSCLSKWRRSRKVEFEVLELEDKLSGEIYDFNLYSDSDLPFLNSKNEASKLI